MNNVPLSSNPNQTETNDTDKASIGRLPFVFLTAVLSIGLVAALFWLFNLGSTQEASGVSGWWYAFSFTTGITMIVLPCTLPLAFVIVPMVIGKGYIKGLATALAFGLGVAITLSMYGIVAAVLGKTIIGAADTGNTGEILKNWFYAVAGLLALLFAFGELGFIKFKMPTYGGAAPAVIQKRKDLLKPLLMGLFLGNIGVGCPHPATPMLLGRIAIEGDIFYGWLLFLVHAVGRVYPLIIMSLLAIIGVNATRFLIAHKDKLANASAWFMIFVGSFLLVLGVFTHDWWVFSGQHTLFEEITQEERITNILSERLDAEKAHRHGPEEVIGKTGMFGMPLQWGNWTLVLLWIIPLWWYYKRKSKIKNKNAK